MPASHTPAPTIHDGMSADEVWAVIDDILESIRLADPSGNDQVFATVNDYVGNRYGD
jgi:hypothetical protein